MNGFQNFLVSLFNPNTPDMKNFLSMVAISFTATNMFAQTDSATYFFQKGNEEKTARLFKPALADYQKSVQFNENNAIAQRELGLVALELRSYDLSIKAFEKVLKLQKEDHVAIENLTNIYFWTRKWNEAIQSAHTAQQLHIGSQNNFIIAKSYYELENYGEALRFLELAYRDDPKNPEVPYMGGRSYVEMSNYKKALGCYEQALAIDSTKTNWVYEAGMVAYAIPDDKKAIYYFEKAAEKGMKKTNDYIENLANAYMNVKAFDKAMPLMDELLKRKPYDMEVLYAVADAYYRTGKYQDAIDTWDRMLAIDDKNANALYMIGMSYQKKGEKEKGQLLCDKAIEMDPSLAKNKQKLQMPGL